MARLTVHRRVPLARRNLLADGRRLLAGVLGVGLALMLVLLLDGLWQGVRRQASIYPDRSGADLFVTQHGVANFLGETSAIPIATVDAVRDTPGVDWAAPVRGQFVVFDLHGKKVPAYLVGSVPGQPGGPWRLAAGRRARDDDEIVVDDVLARRHGLAIGDDLEIGGRTYRIVGRSVETAAVMTGFVVVTHRASDDLFRAPGTTSYVLVGTREVEAVKRRLEARDLTVFTRQQLADRDRRLLTGIFGAPVRLMVAVAFGVGTLVVALTVYASVIERRREYGIVKALGAGRWAVTGVVVRQSLLLAAVGLVVGFGLYLAGRALIAELRPQFSVVLAPGSAVRGVGAAVLMAVLAAVVPARRVAASDPASVYRG